jgi:CheY-like chemotaxis protein
MAANEPSFLYVDDDALSRDVMKILLERIMGFSKVTYFENSHSFMSKIRALPEQPTVIFLDIKMRPHDGFELLTGLRNDPHYQSTKIVALTANVMANDVDKMKQAGFSGLISKPIVHRIFPELVGKVLDGEPVWYIS